MRYCVVFTSLADNLCVWGRRESPTGACFVWHIRRDVGDPMQATHALADAATSLGVCVMDGQCVDSVFIHTLPSGVGSSCPPRYSVHTSTGGIVTADSVVVACGAWASFLEGDGSPNGESVRRRVSFHVPVYPVKGTIWSTEPVTDGYLQKVFFVAESYLVWKKHWKSRDDGNTDPESNSPAGTLLPIPQQCTHDRNGNRCARHA